MPEYDFDMEEEDVYDDPDGLMSTSLKEIASWN